MIYFEIVQGIIDYIEDNLNEDIEIERIVKRTNYSLMQVYRIFSIITGMSIKEYIRRRRLTKALFDIKYSDEPITNIALKSGYSTLESFSRAFRDLFGILPNKYRKECNMVIPTSKPEIMKALIHKASHEAVDNGLYERKQIDIFFTTKPAMKFMGWVNREKMQPAEFYEYCIKKGIDNYFSKIEDNLFCCGACLNKPNPYDMHMYCMAVPFDYDGMIPDNFDIFNIPASEYVVFHHSSYTIEEHGSIINSIWDVAGSFKPENFGYIFNMNNAPVIEIDDDLGYFLHIPVKKNKNKER